MWRPMCIAAALLVILLPSPGSARTGLAVGKQLRLTTAEEWLVGRLVAADERHLTIQVTGQQDRLIIRRADITSLAVNEATRSRGKGALLGAATGAGLGALMGFASGDDPPGFFAFSAEEKAVLGAIVLAPLGALIGVAIPPGKEWREVSATGARVSLAPRRGQAAVSLRLDF